jgi:hypothetical protein
MRDSDRRENTARDRTNDPAEGDTGDEPAEGHTTFGRHRREVVSALLAAGGIGLFGSRPVRGATGPPASVATEHWTDSDGDGLLEAPDYDGIDVDTVHAETVGTRDTKSVEGIVDDERFLRAFIEESGGSGSASEDDVSPEASVVVGHESNEIESFVEGATIGGGKENAVHDDYSVVGGGSGNVAGVADGVSDTQNHATVGGGKNNEATGHNATVAGGSGNSADLDGTVAGGSGNSAGVTGTVAGGEANTARGDSAVGGGTANTAENGGAVGGGSSNTAEKHSVVGGGKNNVADGAIATVGGGKDNDANGRRATIPGGAGNYADGDYSFAAGREAVDNGKDGTIIFGDSTWNEVTPDRPDQFVVQAGGGATLYSSSDLSTGVDLPAGGGSWSSVSARAAKTAVSPVDPQAVLSGVESLEVSTWEYDSEEDAVHMGPMAEAFHQEFGLGADRERIATVDADGVALAAVQGLAERLDEETRDLRAKNERLRERCSNLEARLDALEASASDTGE